MARIVVQYRDGRSEFLRADAVGGRDEWGKIISGMRTCRVKRLAWDGREEDKDEIIRSFHERMELGMCPQVLYLS